MLIFFVYPLQAQSANMLYTDGVQDYIVVHGNNLLSYKYLSFFILLQI
jgi:hypothetical protein